MPDLDTLLAEFAAAYEAGERPDLGETLERASPDERQALRLRIDSYLMTAPRRAWNQAEYESSPAKQSVERVWASLEGVSGSWPELLPHLRHRARIKRAELVRRLAESLSVGDREEKVAGYYNEMEHGRLPAVGISARVFAALGEILGESAERIRRAGVGMPPGGEEQTLPAFTRKALPPDWTEPLADSSPVPGVTGFAHDMAPPGAGFDPAEERVADAGRDEIDELFTGG